MNGMAIDLATPHGVREAWLRAQESPRTEETYTFVIGQWLSWCASRDLDVWQVRRHDVDAWRRSLVRRGLKGVTVAKYLAVAASFYRYGIQDAQAPMEYNPVANVKRPKVSKVSHSDGLTLAETQALRAASLEESPRTATLMHLFLGTALRVSEVTSAKVADLCWDEGKHALAVHRKGGKDGKAPIRDADWPIIDHYLTTRGEVPGGWLLATSGGRRMSRRTAYRIVRELADKAVGRDVAIGPHDIRHTVLTLMLDAGMPIQEARALAGHASTATTELYDRRAHSRGRAGADKVGELLDRGAS